MKTPHRFVSCSWLGPRLRTAAMAGLAGALVGPANAAVTVTVQSMTAAPGEQVIARVLLDDAAQIAGGTFHLTLPMFARPAAAVVTADTAGFLVASRAEPGRLAVSIARAAGLGPGTAAVFAFPIRLSADAPEGIFSLAWGQVELYSDAPVPVAATPVAGSLAVLPSPPDNDQDGLPDPWETDYLGYLGAGGDDDSDADGASNYAEFVAGTDPASADSVFRVGRFEARGLGEAPAVVLEWEGQPGRNYQVFWSEGPVRPDMSWRQVYLPAYQANGTQLRWIDDGTRTHGRPLNDRARYYRVRAEAP